MNRKLMIGSLLLAGGMGLAVASSASAAGFTVLSVNSDGNKNVCSGDFGQGFDNCDVGFPLGLNISPIIAKFNGDDGSVDEINSLYEETVDGTEWSITGTGTGSGTWSYTPDDDEDPAVKYWAAKGGNQGYTFFWQVETSATEAGGACADPSKLFTEACLKAAIAVTSGSWSTPTEQGLSNLSFFNSGRHDDGGSQDIPEPAAMAGLMAVGAGIVLNRRKKA